MRACDIRKCGVIPEICFLQWYKALVRSAVAENNADSALSFMRMHLYGNEEVLGILDANRIVVLCRKHAFLLDMAHVVRHDI